MLWAYMFGLLIGLYTVSSYKDCKNEDFNDTEPPSVYTSLSQFKSTSQGKSCQLRFNSKNRLILVSGALNPNTQREFSRKIDLQNNLILEVQNDPFYQSGVCLVILDLSHNIISIIQDNAFSALWSLQKLDLSFNNLTELNNNAFASINQIDFINLNNNKLKTIDNLTNLQSITVLKLANNRLELHSGMFKNFPNLLDLDLSENRISNIPLGLFDGIPKLEYLNLGNNKLKGFAIGTFSRLSSLKLLNLSSNLLQSTEFTNQEVFSPMLHIQTLLLDDNTKLTKLNVTNLKIIFPYLSDIGVDKIPWICEALKKFLNDCKNHKINIISKNSIPNAKNTARFSCTKHNTSLIPSLKQPSVSSTQSIPIISNPPFNEHIIDHNNLEKHANETVSIITVFSLILLVLIIVSLTIFIAYKNRIFCRKQTIYVNDTRIFSRF